MKNVRKNYIWWHDKKNEEKPITCAHIGCKNKGEYKAPIHNKSLGKYQFFCLKHITEFNKKWNFFEGMDENQLKFELETQIYQGESWPFGIKDFQDPAFRMHPLRNMADPFEFFDKKNSKNEPQQEQPQFLLDSSENNALALLDLDMPFTAEELKKNYRKLARLYHPDTNQQQGNENMLKSINQAYAIAKSILKRFS